MWGKIWEEGNIGDHLLFGVEELEGPEEPMLQLTISMVVIKF
jgi:hypothetical protein